MDDLKTHYRYRHNPIGAFILIAFGILLLLNNFGVVSIDIWRQIWQFWPLILILAGVQLILGRSLRSRIIIDILAIILIALVVLYSLALTDPAWKIWVNHNLPTILSPGQSTLPLPSNRYRMNYSSGNPSYYSY